jgi:predicted transcriptional regulator
MKTATLPSLRVAPELREAAEDVLREGETLSAFLESALRAQIEQRRMQAQFVARGLASRDRARETGRYVPAETVLAELEAKVQKAKKKAR